MTGNCRHEWASEVTAAGGLHTWCERCGVAALVEVLPGVEVTEVQAAYFLPSDAAPPAELVARVEGVVRQVKRAARSDRRRRHAA